MKYYYRLFTDTFLYNLNGWLELSNVSAKEQVEIMNLELHKMCYMPSLTACDTLFKRMQLSRDDAIGFNFFDNMILSKYASATTDLNFAYKFRGCQPLSSTLGQSIIITPFMRPLIKSDIVLNFHDLYDNPQFIFDVTEYNKYHDKTLKNIDRYIVSNLERQGEIIYKTVPLSISNILKIGYNDNVLKPYDFSQNFFNVDTCGEGRICGWENFENMSYNLNNYYTDNWGKAWQVEHDKGDFYRFIT